MKNKEIETKLQLKLDDVNLNFEKDFLEKLIETNKKFIVALGEAYPETSQPDQEKIAIELINQVSINLFAGNKISFLEEVDKDEFNISIFNVKPKHNK